MIILIFSDPLVTVFDRQDFSTIIWFVRVGGRAATFRTAIAPTIIGTTACVAVKAKHTGQTMLFNNSNQTIKTHNRASTHFGVLSIHIYTLH